MLSLDRLAHLDGFLQFEYFSCGEEGMFLRRFYYLELGLLLSNFLHPEIFLRFEVAHSCEAFVQLRNAYLEELKASPIGVLSRCYWFVGKGKEQAKDIDDQGPNGRSIPGRIGLLCEEDIELSSQASQNFIAARQIVSNPSIVIEAEVIRMYKV